MDTHGHAGLCVARRQAHCMKQTPLVGARSPRPLLNAGTASLHRYEHDTLHDYTFDRT